MGRGEGVQIQLRHLHIDYGALPSSPGDWYDGDAAVTEVFHALSVTFPAGESFFMDSVQHFGRQLREDHPALWGEVVLFLKQEALHSAAHEKWNLRVQEEFGHPMAELERIVNLVMQCQQRILSPMWQLACTVAFEHLTATFGYILLQAHSAEDACGRRRMRAPQRWLWTWHALEEIEHKSVAFDVYEAVGGGYLQRAVAMLWATLVFAITFGLVRIFLHWRRGILLHPKTALSMFYFGLISPGYGWRFLWPYVQFFRPNFHPWQHHDEHLDELITYHSAVLAAQAQLRRPAKDRGPVRAVRGGIVGVYQRVSR